MTERTKWVVHNCIAHPLLVLWPRLGDWLHDRTIPDTITVRCELCGTRYVFGEVHECNKWVDPVGDIARAKAAYRSRYGPS